MTAVLRDTVTTSAMVFIGHNRKDVNFYKKIINIFDPKLPQVAMQSRSHRGGIVA